MKKIIIFSLALVFLGSAVFAQGQKGPNNSITDIIDSEQNQQGQGTGQGQQVQTEQQTQNQGEEEQLMIMRQQRQQVTAGEINEVKQRIQQRQQEMTQEMQSMGKTEQKVYQNQNQVRLAVHSLLEMKDVMGGIGFEVSRIAQEFNNSAQTTIKAEEKIKTRNRVVKFFAGGDQETAESIEQEVNRNREKIQQLNQLKEQCNCDEEIMAMLQEQIQNMEQEQNRLEQLAQGEKQYRGLFGWLFGWMKK